MLCVLCDFECDFSLENIINNWKICQKHKEEIEMEIRFGKFKGKTIEEVAGNEEGINYLNWLREKQDPNDPKFGKSNKKMIDEINRVLSNKTVYISDKPSNQEKNKTSTYSNQTSENNEILKKIYNDIQLIKARLEIEPEEKQEKEQLPF